MCTVPKLSFLPKVTKLSGDNQKSLPVIKDVWQLTTACELALKENRNYKVKWVTDKMIMADLIKAKTQY